MAGLVGRRRSRKGHDDEEHENHERWLVTYADMITLLMVLFIVLFAMSQVDQKKFNELRTGLAAGFGQSTSILDGSQSILQEPGSSVAEPITPPQFDQMVPPVDQVAVNQAVASALKQDSQRKYAAALNEVHRLEKIQQRLNTVLAKHGLQGDVQSVINGRGLVVSLVSRHVVFQNNLATLTPRGRLVLQVIAPVLNSITDPLSIEGHTNQVPVKPKYYATDWDLSAARAVTVLRYLNEQLGVRTNRLSAAAWGHTKPLIPPSKPGSQQLNKRVDIVIRPNLPDETSHLLAVAAKNG